MHDPSFALDLLCIIPAMLSQTIDRSSSRFFYCLTCLKLFRLFRLTRHARCLEIFVEVLYINLKDLLMLTILIVFGMFYFGLTQFVLEQLNEESDIKSIGEALWHVCELLDQGNVLFAFSRVSLWSSRWVIPTLLNISFFPIRWLLSVCGLDRSPWRLSFPVSRNRFRSSITFDIVEVWSNTNWIKRKERVEIERVR